MNERAGLLHLLGVDRLLYFTDALVAIAATLLVLPLVEAAGAYVQEHPSGSAGAFLSSESGALLAFAISFLVIVRLWMAHHRLFSIVTAADSTLIWLDLAWGFTIVLLPLPTELTQLVNESSAVAFYVGTMLASSLLLMLVVLHVRRRPELRAPGPEPLLAPAVATTSLFALALVIGAWRASYLPLLILLASGILADLLGRRLDRHDADH
jgi:uncharacterized membrane protein